MTVPHLTTALTGPLQQLESHILRRTVDIEHWLRSQWHEHTAPFYASVDLRNAGFKLAPVDTNLFPGGFNNLNPDFHALCVQAERGEDQSLNAPGMQFVPLAFAEPCSSPNPKDPGCPPNRFYSYGVIARLALLAAAIEIERTNAVAEPALLRAVP